MIKQGDYKMNSSNNYNPEELKNHAKKVKILGIASIVITVLGIAILIIGDLKAGVISIILNFVFQTNDFNYNDSLDSFEIGIYFCVFFNQIVSTFGLVRAEKLKKAYFGKLSSQDETNIDIGIICSVVGMAFANILPFIFLFI